MLIGTDMAFNWLVLCIAALHCKAHHGATAGCRDNVFRGCEFTKHGQDAHPLESCRILSIHHDTWCQGKVDVSWVGSLLCGQGHNR
jgi:hypothetical protein